MAISTNDLVRKFGTQDTVTSSSAAVSSAAYSVVGSITEWTNDDDTPEASFVLTMQYPSGTITTGGVQLLCRLKDVDGTGDEPSLTANWIGHFLGNFVTGTGMSATTNYSIELGPVELPVSYTSNKYEFYILNSCGVTISAGWTLKVTPISVGPKA